MGSDAKLEKPVNDAQPNPEPAAPSLPEPDPGVYHHEIDNEHPRNDTAS